MAMLFSSFAYLADAAMVVCFIMVIIAMFQNNNSGLGIACLVLILCGIGGLIAFIYGWMKSSEWGITYIMMGWTAALLISIACHALAAVFGMSVTA